MRPMKIVGYGAILLLLAGPATFGGAHKSVDRAAGGRRRPSVHRRERGPGTDQGRRLRGHQPALQGGTGPGPGDRSPFTPRKISCTNYQSEGWFAENNAIDAQLVVTITWLDKDGADVDIKRANQYFPPDKRVWVLTKNSATPVECADI